MLDLDFMRLKDNTKDIYREKFLSDGIRYVYVNHGAADGISGKYIGFSAPQRKDLAYLVRNGEPLAEAMREVRGTSLNMEQTWILESVSAAR